MDTRIYELAKQAGYKVKTLYKVDDDYQTEHYIKDDVLEKFAELIVQECISEALSMRYAGNVAVADRLEKHFGVKQ